MARRSDCQVIYLGAMDYLAAWDLQKKLAQRVYVGETPDSVLVVEHPPTYTMGRLGRRDQVLVDDEGLARLNAPLYEVDRGGQVTFHGPGQLVMYPVVNLRDRWGPVQYVRTLEQVIVRCLSDHGVAGGTLEGLTGVWVGDGKIGAIGVKISRGIAYHGLSLNVNTDLSWYDHIVPCGIEDRPVVSMAKLLDHSVDMDMVTYSMIYHFGQLMGYRMREAQGDTVRDELCTSRLT